MSQQSSSAEATAPVGPGTARPFKGRLWPGLLVTAILLFTAGNSYLGYDAQRSQAADYEDLERINDGLLLLSEVRNLVADAETGQRGYMLTRDPSYRQPYDDAIATLRSTMNELGDRLRAVSFAAVLYDPLSDSIDAKVRELSRTLQYAEENDFNVGLYMTQDDAGRQLMNDIRAASDAIEVTLVAQLEFLEAARIRSRTRMLAALLAAGGASIVLLWALVAMGRRDARRKEQVTALLLRRNDALDVAVQERTGELEQAIRQFDRSNRELENFAYVVSHDLQEPLRKIRAFGDRLLQTQRDNLEPQAVDYIGRMHSAAARMSILLNDLLTFSRVNTRGLEFVDVDLNDLIATVLEDLEIAIEERSATVETDLFPVIRGDETQLRQLLQNIIANALKFQPAGQVPHVRIKRPDLTDSDREPGFVRIDVCDNGIGFDERYLDRIFDPFQRLHGRTEYQGSGIGLAICRRVAERHGGFVSATSSPGSGSVFSITLLLDAEGFADGSSVGYTREDQS